jgi:hypothetical protein
MTRRNVNSPPESGMFGLFLKRAGAPNVCSKIRNTLHVVLSSCEKVNIAGQSLIITHAIDVQARIGLK